MVQSQDNVTQSLFIMNVKKSLSILQFVNSVTSGFISGVSVLYEKISTVYCYDEKYQLAVIVYAQDISNMLAVSWNGTLF